MDRLPGILTIAGSDSGGGAGIQADLKTIAMLGGYGLSVITALTAQNTMGVSGIHAPEPGFVAEQLRTVLSDIPVAAAKTGMLFSAEIIHAVAEVLGERSFPLVVDPVCVSQSGSRLLKADAIEALVGTMLPLADLLTPNRPEAEVIAGVPIDGEADVRRAIERMLDLGAKAVLLKGGHFEEGELTDWLGLPGGIRPIRVPRVSTRHTHGTGCTLSAAIATHLGLGFPLEEAVERAQAYLNLCLRAGFAVGRGAGPVNHSAPLLKERGRLAALEEAAEAGERLRDMEGLAALAPKGGMEFALAVPWPVGESDVASIRGDGSRCGGPAFGRSSPLVRVVLEAGRTSPEVRCGVSIRCGEDVDMAMKDVGIEPTRVVVAADLEGVAILGSGAGDVLDRVECVMRRLRR